MCLICYVGLLGFVNSVVLDSFVTSFYFCLLDLDVCDFVISLDVIFVYLRGWLIEYVVFVLFWLFGLCFDVIVDLMCMLICFVMLRFCCLLLVCVLLIVGCCDGMVVGFG